MNIKKLVLPVFFLLIICTACNTVPEHEKTLIPKYVAEDPELFEAIATMDSIYFDAYNSCDLEKQADIYADDIEFYHDKGGLTTSKQELMNALEENICGKVTRELVEGSIEVYPIKDYGAVEIGYHKFFNIEEPNAPSRPSKFVVLWNKKTEGWKIAKVISLH